MSAITLERPFIKAEKPTTQPADRGCSREEEFRAALDSYIARYVAEQTNRLSVVSSRNNPYALMWFPPLRRLLKATRQIWRFRTNWRGLAAPVSAPEVVSRARSG